MRQAGVMQCLGALAAAAGWLVAVRWWPIPGLPHYAWVPNLGTVRALLDDTRGLLSLAGCAGVILPLGLAGMRGGPPRIAPLKSLFVLMALPPLYAALSVRVEGRIVWGLYPFLIPFAVSLGLPRRAAARLISPPADTRAAGAGTPPAMPVRADRRAAPGPRP